MYVLLIRRFDLVVHKVIHDISLARLNLLLLLSDMCV